MGLDISIYLTTQDKDTDRMFHFSYLTKDEVEDIKTLSNQQCYEIVKEKAKRINDKRYKALKDRYGLTESSYSLKFDDNSVSYTNSYEKTTVIPLKEYNEIYDEALKDSVDIYLVDLEDIIGYNAISRGSAFYIFLKELFYDDMRKNNKRLLVINKKRLKIIRDKMKNLVIDDLGDYTTVFFFTGILEYALHQKQNVILGFDY